MLYRYGLCRFLFYYFIELVISRHIIQKEKQTIKKVLVKIVCYIEKRLNQAY